MRANYANSDLVSYRVGGRATVGRSPMLRLRPSRSRRPGLPPVPPGVWAEPPAGPCSLILSGSKRLWDGTRAPGRAPRVWNACIRGENTPQCPQPLSREAGMLSLTCLRLLQIHNGSRVRVHRQIKTQGWMKQASGARCLKPEISVMSDKIKPMRLPIGTFAV